MLGLFVNTLAADGKYSLLIRDNLLEHLQMQFSQKEKAFSQVFLPFPKFKSNFEDFQKKDDRHS